MTQRRHGKTEIDAIGEQMDVLRAQMTVLAEENRLLREGFLEMSKHVFDGGQQDGHEGEAAARLWAACIMTGERAYEQTPPLLMGKVQMLLHDSG